MEQVTVTLRDGTTRTLQIHEMGILDAQEAIRMRREARERAQAEPDWNPLEAIQAYYFWPIIVNSTTCKDGEVPTFKEFVEMGRSQSNIWYLAVDKLNPGAIPDPDQQTTEMNEPTEAELEKKD